MKLNRKTLRRMILKEIKLMTETQKSVGLPHEYDAKQLYHHVLRFISEHPNLRTSGSDDPATYEKARLLQRILDNAVRDAVQHSTYRRGDIHGVMSGDISHEEYEKSIGHNTTPEETEAMLDDQDLLKLARRALDDALTGGWNRYRTGRGPGSSAISDKMRSLAQSGQLKPGMIPSDVPELRRNMPAYQPGGRHYDPDDIIWKK